MPTRTEPARWSPTSYPSALTVVIESLNEIKADMLAGRINPGQLKIVREIITTGATAADKDVAFYAGPREDYTIVHNGNGTVTVIDNVVTPILLADGTLDALLGDEGTDTLKNMEILRFTDRDAAGAATGTFTEVAIGRRGRNRSSGDCRRQRRHADRRPDAECEHHIDRRSQWPRHVQLSVAGCSSRHAGEWCLTNINGATGSSFTPAQAQVSQILRVVVYVHRRDWHIGDTDVGCDTRRRRSSTAQVAMTPSTDRVRRRGQWRWRLGYAQWPRWQRHAERRRRQ